MNYLLFVVYLLVLCWLLVRISFVKHAGISRPVLLALFIGKVLAGIAIGWVSIHVYGPGNDYWDVHDFAREEYQLMFSDPGKYLVNIFTSGYPDGYAGLFSSGNSYWNDLRGNILIKMVSVFNIFSRGDYYINSLFFNFIVFFGHLIFYRLFSKLFPGKNRLVIVGCFLLPSTLYFTSGIHKDGLIFLLLAILIYAIFQSLVKERFTGKRAGMILGSLLLIFLIRNFVFLALVPALVAWGLAVKTKWPAGLCFAGVYLVGFLVIFNIDSIMPAVQPLDVIRAKQTAYLQLRGSDTNLEMTPLAPTFRSFVRNAPQAWNHSFLRPYLWEVPVKTLWPLVIELFLYQLVFILFLFFRKRTEGRFIHAYLLFTVFFIASSFLVIGYIVPNLGSLVRYRSLYLPLLMTPLIGLIDWENLARLIRIRK